MEWASTETQNQYKAEVRAIRAMIYFWKTEQYGDFPFFTNVLETPEEALLSRTDVGTIREFIVAELEDCIQYLPDKSGTEQGRINKQAVQAVLMRYYLYLGDYANALSYAKEIKESGQFSMPASLSYADVFPACQPVQQ